MISPDWKLSVLTFPQFWDNVARRIDLRAVVLPRNNPLEQLLTGIPPASDEPAFADAELTFDIRFIPSLERLPDPAGVQFSQTVSGKTPPDLRVLYEDLADRFPLAPPGAVLPEPKPRRAKTRILKYLPVSYRNAFAFNTPRTSRAFVDDSYQCALRKPPGPIPPSTPSPGLRWGQVIAGVLSQPRLAERLGLIYQLSLNIPEDVPVEQGGWLFVSFAPGTTYSSLLPPQKQARLYAACIPSLDAAQGRTLFAPVLFPVPAPPLSFDENILEAQTWDDGFAKIVHCTQPSHGDLLDNSTDPTALVQDGGIQLGWDDEQLVIWFNRQADPDPLVEAHDSPLGVHGYRVDVRRAGSQAWTSLARVEGDLILGPFNEHFVGEHSLRVAPLQLHGLRQGDFWMPSYFARWNGKSLSVGDDFTRKLKGSAGTAPTWKPIGIGDVPLRYGESYEFRVRLADISGGGPTVDRDPVHPAEAPIAVRRFLRFVPPKAVRVEKISPLDPDQPQLSYQVRRPVLGYPSLVYTGFPNAEQALLADAPQAQAEGRELGLPDPDVTSLEIEVAVFDPSLDEEHAYRRLYTTTREFPADGADALTLQVVFQDFNNVALLGNPAGSGPLPLPTARDLRLQLVAVCRPDPDLKYFGSQEIRRSTPVTIQNRAHSQNETGLFARQQPAEQLHAHMLQPDPTPDGLLAAVQAADGRQDEAPGSTARRLADRLNLQVKGLSFMCKPDQRTVFGCSQDLRHVLSLDHGAITFASEKELTHHWIVAISLILDRDWTWDGLADQSIQIARKIEWLRNGRVEESSSIGTLELPRGIHYLARQSADPKDTRIVFFDAVDPKPLVGEFPSEIKVTYSLIPAWRGQPIVLDSSFIASLKLPMAAPPTQTAKLASAGIGLSPYQRPPGYNYSEPRHRSLWLEFGEPIADERDAPFARVLAYAPDPMLTGLEPPSPPLPVEPTLPVPSESIRSIIPGQSQDSAGLDAMQPLISSDSPRHFYLPIPPGLSEESLRTLRLFYV